MDLSGTGTQPWPLQAGGVDNPTLTSGGATTWQLNTVPDRCPTGPLAYLLPCVTLTISGTVVQAASGGSTIYWDQLVTALIGQIDWTTSWYGTVLSGNHVKGSDINVIETISGGMQKGLYPRPPFPSTSGTYPFEMTINLPANSCRFGRLLRHTSQLAKCFQTSNLKVTMAASSVLTGLSAGATFGTLTAYASAQLVPTADLILGTPIEWILQQPTASANSNQITIKGFGTDTMLTGVEPKGGVLWLGELSSLNNQAGVLTADQITQYAFPWRGQQITKHPQSVLSGFLGSMADGRPSVFPAFVAGGDSQFASYPYANNTSDAQTASGAAALMDLKGLLAWLMVHPGRDCYLTDLQTAQNDQNYFANASGAGFAAGSHQILGAYAKVWSDSMRANWQALITDGGAGSLAAYVINGQGGDYTKAKMNKMSPRGLTTADQGTYLPSIFA